MADNIFREVDEDIRREQVRRLWDRFGPYVLALAVLIVLGVGAYKIWEYWQVSQAQGSGDKFAAAITLADQNKTDDAIKALQDLEKSGTGSYPVLARFRIAAVKADSGDKTGAVADYDAIAAGGDVPADVRDLARIRAALLLVDTAPQAEITMRVSALAATGSPWRGSAREILALSAYRAGDYTTAKNYFDQIDADQEGPMDMRQRAELMLSLIAAKLPQAAAPAATPGAAPAPEAAAPAAPAPNDAPAPAALAPATADTPSAPPVAAAPATPAPEQSAAPTAAAPESSATPAPAPSPDATPAPAPTASAPAPESPTPAPAPAPADTSTAPAPAASAPEPAAPDTAAPAAADGAPASAPDAALPEVQAPALSAPPEPAPASPAPAGDAAPTVVPAPPDAAAAPAQ